MMFVNGVELTPEEERDVAHLIDRLDILRENDRRKKEAERKARAKVVQLRPQSIVIELEDLDAFLASGALPL